MREQTVLVNGRKVHFLCAGVWSERAVVVLHGWGQAVNTYKVLIKDLSRDNFVVAPDLPGFGESEQTNDLTLAAFAEQVKGVLDTLKTTEAVLIGHSMGGPVAIKLAIGDQERIQQIFLFGSAGIPPRRSWIGWLLVNVRNFFYNLRSGGKTENTFQDTLKAVLYAVRRPLWYWKTFRLTTSYHICKDSTKVKAKTEIIWGDEETFFPETEQLGVYLGVRSIYVKNRGHDLIFMFPQQAAKLIRDLLARQE